MYITITIKISVQYLLFNQLILINLKSIYIIASLNFNELNQIIKSTFIDE